MHQPSYQDKNGVLQMPWVFLHSIKDYLDMPWLLSKYPNLKATFNLTPTLINQIKIYEKEGFKKDKFLSIWIKDVKELTKDEKSYLLKICKSAQYDTMVKPFKRYDEIFSYKEYDEIALLDLQMLFMLSWCGNYLRENDKTVQELIQKGRYFAQNDKENLLDTLLRFIPKILPFYKKLLKTNQISISTTPYNHPILPLLFDMENAKISNPTTVLPKEYISLRDDAKKQVDLAIELYEKIFEQKPTGFWPAEGAVDEKSLHYYKEKDLKWVATDEAILYKSLHQDDKELKYKRYSYNDIFIGFRDHFLSDLIGFSYRYQDSYKAANDFVGRMETKKEGDSVFVIVDGENAWEFYKNNAKDFFMALYKLLNSSKDIKTLTFDEISRQKSKNLTHLHPGSWIYGNFDTWVGHSEKNRAWELLYQTKRDMIKCDKRSDKSIEEHFLIAECSDWYWWYGEDHFSDFLSEFDTLFRSHLIDIYELCSLKVPTYLFLPITKEREVKLTSVKPKFEINVKIDGKKSSFYEWLGCGMVDESRIFSTMQGGGGVVKKLYYGENGSKLFLRLDGDTKKILSDFKEIKIHFKELKIIKTIPIKTTFEDRYIQMAIKDFVEISIDKKLCKNKKGINLQIELVDKMDNIELIPIFGDIEVCDDEYERNWFI